jgi:hypothetical protein
MEWKKERKEHNNKEKRGYRDLKERKKRMRK